MPLLDNGFLRSLPFDPDMFDPLVVARATEEMVAQGELRRYYRFRAARFYGGISTADCVGCCLRCVFCWSWKEVAAPERYGQMCSSESVVQRLVSIARKKRFRQVRVSGNEPTIGREHLVGVLERIPTDLLFILETNGILIGADGSYAQELAEFRNLHVRVSLKGATEEEFSRLTGARPEGFRLQLRALENLVKAGVSVHPACMVSFSTSESISSLRARLARIDPSFRQFEVEELILYPEVERRLAASGLAYKTAHRPESVPPEQV